MAVIPTPPRRGTYKAPLLGGVDAMKKLAGVLTQGHSASTMINYILKEPQSTSASQTKRYGVVKLRR